MENEYYYRQELQNKIEEFILKETKNDNPFLWVGDNMGKLMADAAFAVLRSSIDVQDYLNRENLLNK